MMDKLFRLGLALAMLAAGGLLAHWVYRPAQTYSTCTTTCLGGSK